MHFQIETDIRNNSAWSHRYFSIFGHEELDLLESPSNLTLPKPLIRKDLFSVRNGGRRPDNEGNLLAVDENIRDREVQYAKGVIEKAPQNPSPWLYLRGVVRRCDIPEGEFEEFCLRFVLEQTNPTSLLRQNQQQQQQQQQQQKEKIDFQSPSVRSSHAISWLADIYSARVLGYTTAQTKNLNNEKEKEKEKERGEVEEAKLRAKECWTSLALKWDPIRRNYWNWRIRELEVGREGIGL
jgi:protein farnesyltransferase/geranylgeranyltransferase type-1 subunit alpha